MSFGPVKIKQRNRRYTHTVDVDVDISLADLETGDLMEELKERGELRDESAEHAELLGDIADVLRRGDVGEALVIIERALSPKWDDEKRSLEAYVKLMGRAPAVAS